jgi:hypothetical protein
LDNYSDVVQTYFFSFNKNKITNRDNGALQMMIVGNYNPLSHPILDFFDPVSFDIINNGGKICLLDPEKVGGLTVDGNRNNGIGVNDELDFGTNIAHFAGIGSGRAFFTNKSQSYSGEYLTWSKKRYVLYHKLFYGIELSDDYDKITYQKIKKVLDETNIK